MKKVANINVGLCDRSPFCPVKRVCPVDAVTQEGSFFNSKAPVVDEKKCIGCEKCLAYCPHGAVSMKSIN